jgi:hypothetical protein
MPWMLLVAVVLFGLWVAAPTLRTLLSRDFEPTRRSDGSVFWAQQSSHP